MPFVIDASIMANWLFQDERTEAGIRILAQLRQDQARQPAIWWFEISNVLLLGERRGRATREQSDEFAAFLETLPISVASLPDRQAVFALARRHRLTFYDAAYLELAQREGIALATLDQALAKATVAEGVALIGMNA